MEDSNKKYAAFLTRLQEELMTAATQLPEPAKEQLSLLKEYTEVFAAPKRR